LQSNYIIYIYIYVIKDRLYTYKIMLINPSSLRALNFTNYFYKHAIDLFRFFKRTDILLQI